MPFKFSEGSTRRDDRRDRRFDEKSADGEHFRKLFVGGLSYETTKEDLDKHFGEYGEILDSVVMIYPDSKRSRGFGFVTFDSMASVDAVQDARPHVIDGREVETKRATPREQNTGRDSAQCVKKLFIGGVPEEASEEDIRASCDEFGRITEVDIIKHRDTGKPRGFCFVTFDDYDPVDKICMKGYVEVLDKKVEVKKATPKDAVRRDRFGGDRRERGGGGYFGDRGDRDGRYSERDGRYGDERRERYRSRSPVRYDRYSGGRSSGGGGSGYGGGSSGGYGASANYNQSGQSTDAMGNLTQLAPALASLGTLMGILSNNSSGGSGVNALNHLVSALGAGSGSGTGAVTAPYSGDSGASRGSYNDRDNSYGANSSYNSSSGYGASYSSGYGSGYGGRGTQKDDYSR